MLEIHFPIESDKIKSKSINYQTSNYFSISLFFSYIGETNK